METPIAYVPGRSVPWTGFWKWKKAVNCLCPVHWQPRRCPTARVIAVILAVMPLWAAGDEYDNNLQYIPGQVIVVTEGEPDAPAEDVQKAFKGTVKRHFTLARRAAHRRRIPSKAGSTSRLNMLLVELPDGKTVEQAMEQGLPRLNSRILTVEPNYRLAAAGTPADPLFSQMWAMNNTGQTGGIAQADIDALRAWDITTGSREVVVAVIDTGIDYQHVDLAQNMWVNTSEIPDNGIDDDQNGYIDDVFGYDFSDDDHDPADENGHGTHCAGTIAAAGNNHLGVAGVNWQCSLMACRFLDAGGSGTTIDAIDAINYAVANGADILNNSWGGGNYSQALKAAIENAYDNGVLFVAAAGNSGTNNDTAPFYPAGYDVPNVIAVAASDHGDELAYFSCYGLESVHLAAPGVSILSTLPGDRYGLESGTSMAAPHVAGAAALVLAAHPDILVEQLKTRVVYTGDPLQSLENVTISGRRLNAYYALEAEDVVNVLEPDGGETWTQNFTWQIKWISLGGGPTVDIYLMEGNDTIAQLADDTPNDGSFDWRISDGVPPGSNYRVLVDDGTSTDASEADFGISDQWTDYFTEVFSNPARQFDLDGKSLLLTPDGSGGYRACLADIEDLPADPDHGINLAVGDDDFSQVNISGHSVVFYGTEYQTFYIGSNGYISFLAGDTEYSESTAKHFSKERISVLFDDLDPSSGGNVVFEQLTDRIAVTWHNIPEYGRYNSNTFQAELFYDGRIRMSWPNIQAQDGLVGLSSGGGLPPDFIMQDISGYEKCPAELSRIEISGPAEVDQNSGAQLTCTAYYVDDTTSDITADNTVSWTQNCDIASINDLGYLETGSVQSYLQCTVSASYGEKTDTYLVLIKTSEAVANALSGCMVRAGRTKGKDHIRCSGAFTAVPSQVANATSIDVQIGTVDNLLLYQQSLDFDPDDVRNGRFNYIGRYPRGSGGIRRLSLDMNRGTFALLAQNIDLTGLDSRVFVSVQAGDYIVIGQADEQTINGRRPIPITLLNGYRDSLRIDTARMTQGGPAGSDTLMVRASLAVKDKPDRPGDMIFTWDAQEFTVPAAAFRSAGNRHACGTYSTAEGSTVRAGLDLDRGTLILVIRKQAIWPRSGTVDFSLSFQSYAGTTEIDLP